MAEEGREQSPRDSPIGGQAVLEGVMMRGISTWAVAVRKAEPDQLGDNGRLDPTEAARGPIEVVSEPLVSWVRRHRMLRLPIVRGVVALAESLKIGFTALGISANAQAEQHDEELGRGTWVGTVILSVVLAIGLFFLVPVGIASLLKSSLHPAIVFVLVEKAIRISIFLLYLWLISRMRDLERVFQYHGAEHKTISCYEAGLPLTPQNAMQFSRLHSRCGTSFLLILLVLSLVVLAPLGTPAWYILFPSRVIGIPLVAGLAFELIKLLGKKRSRRWAQILMWPGMQLQKLTTREPDLSHLAVAI